MLGFISSIVTTVCVILALQRPAHRIGLVDKPGGRKQHDGSVPLIGGIAIFLGFLAGLPFNGMDMLTLAGPLLGALALVLCGIYDDMRDMRSLHKLAVQALAATALVLTADNGIIESLGRSFDGSQMLLGVLAIPFSILCVTGFINAVNMMDGIDGLTGGYALVSLVGLFALILLGGNTELIPAITVLAGATLGFLAFNFPYRQHRRKVFLGDAGSMLLGYLLAWFAITQTQQDVGAIAIAPGAIAWILALPVIDTLSLMLRRMLNGRSPFSADRNHMHHLCLRAGFSPRQTALILLSGALVTVAVGFAGAYYRVPDLAMYLGITPIIAIHQRLISRSATELRIRRVPGVMATVPNKKVTPLPAQRAAREQGHDQAAV